MLISLRYRSALCGALVFASVCGLAACSKPQADQAEASASSAASEVGDAAANASSAVSDAVTSDTPQDFVTKVGIANIFEIETSKLALKVSKNADVKALAKTIIDDHTKVGVAFKAALVADAPANLIAPKVLDEAHQKKLDDLKTKTGEDFDKAYIDLQKGAHSDAVKVFDNYVKNGTDATLKTFAGDTLPTLQAHKDAVDKL